MTFFILSRFMRQELISAIKANQKTFGVDIPDDKVERLADYYELVQKHNALLHLVAPCSPEEFATRHILESLTMLEFLPHATKFCDVGSGAGLPAIPCLLVRGDLSASLIESKEKKTKFLQTAVDQLGLSGRALVVNKQFAETDPADAEVITCRALDKLVDRLSMLTKWARGRKLLLFGGRAAGQQLDRLSLDATSRLMPLSEQRYLFALN